MPSTAPKLGSEALRAVFARGGLSKQPDLDLGHGWWELPEQEKLPGAQRITVL